MERDNQHYPLAAHAEREFEILVHRFQIVNAGDLRRVRSAANLAFQLIQFVLRSGRGNLDGSIVPVSYPSGESQTPAGNSHEPAKSDALHAPSYKKMRRRHAWSAAHSKQHCQRRSHRRLGLSVVKTVDHELAAANPVSNSSERICDLIRT